MRGDDKEPLQFALFFTWIYDAFLVAQFWSPGMASFGLGTTWMRTFCEIGPLGAIKFTQQPIYTLYH